MAKTLQRSFTGGELSPAMFGRIDDQKYQTGLAVCRNMVALAQGPVRNRSGFEFVRQAKYNYRRCRLIPFVFNNDQTMVLEFGEFYVRFHTQGATLMNGENPLELPTPYGADDLPEIRYAQSADVVTLVHPSYPPMELKRYSWSDWRLEEITFGTPLPAPTNVTAKFVIDSHDNLNNKDLYTEAQKTMYNLKYRVTALRDDGSETLESEASATGACDGNVYLQNSKVEITWDAVPGATRYRIYKTYSGVFGFIGTADTPYFEDTNIAADHSYTPPRYDSPFEQPGALRGIDVIEQGTLYQDFYNALQLNTYHASTEIKLTNYTSYRNLAGEYQLINLGELVQAPIASIVGEVGGGGTLSLTYTTHPQTEIGAEGIPVVTSVRIDAAIRITGSGNGYTNPKLHIKWCDNKTQSKSRSFTEMVADGIGGYKHGIASVAAEYADTVTEIDLATFTSRPSVEIRDTAGAGYGATARPVVTNGRITDVVVINPGTGYDPATTEVTITGGGGEGCVLRARPAESPKQWGTGDYPGAVSYFDQRRIFAGTRMQPQHIWMTRSGTGNDMSYTLPSQPDNRISFRLAALEASRIQHVVPLQSLVILTDTAEFRLTTANDDAITPASVGVKPQSYIGASGVQPVVANSTLLYVSSRGSHIRELGYNGQAGGFVTGDLTLRAEHLFDNNKVIDMALTKAPSNCLWCAMSDGSLIGCTYLPDQSVGAWHRHDTEGGWFESVACVPEGDEDILYAVVRRVINGQTVRYIERMHERQIVNKEDGFFVDSGLTYNGAAITSVRGLEHLEGMTVAILADGKVLPQQKVVGGRVTLPIPASKLCIGLPITAEIQTLPCVINSNDGDFGQGRRKNVSRVFVRVYRSSAVSIGPDTDTLRDYPARRSERYGEPPELRSEELEMVVAPAWSDSGQICLRHTNPLPLMICGITADIQI